MEEGKMGAATRVKPREGLPGRSPSPLTGWLPLGVRWWRWEVLSGGGSAEDCWPQQQ